ncbi:hypothetical protein PanWU01x14_038770 [Parasponia andersonii]|uniref:Uncharacterized protein n=1 Tax=Parasponia andersonii TaxID=3476 RepID=A0A2P5DRK7_PARAD|nr:hypothetical protein PanWU01x14_038770 [Parasponia andersonii]
MNEQDIDFDKDMNGWIEVMKVMQTLFDDDFLETKYVDMIGDKN